MKRTGAWLAVNALENIGVKHTFGIPGVHNTEIYDELNRSEKIRPILVTHELGAAYMADAVSRTSDSIGVAVIVPAAGTTHAMSGIGEAYLDGIPMIIISGGIRRDSKRSFQLHDIDQMELVRPLTKAAFLIRDHEEVVPTIYEAFRIAVSGDPGPVFIEIPVEIQLFQREVNRVPAFPGLPKTKLPSEESIQFAVELLRNSKKPGIFLGWGARFAKDYSIHLAEFLHAPVATTLQGKSVFPADHPLYTGMGFGNYSVPAAENAFKDCDCLLAVGTRFGEIATGSFGMKVPKTLVHVDINPEVFGKNYPVTVSLEGDARDILSSLSKSLISFPRSIQAENYGESLRKNIRVDKDRYQEEWTKTAMSYVNPAKLFSSLRELLPRDGILVTDDGNHTFLAAELFPVFNPRTFISPTDFNSMGYCVPAAIGAKLANPSKAVAAIVGDGAFLMTGLEILTATTNSLGIVFIIFHDGELSQISQGQEIPYNRKTCTVLGKIKIEGIAEATGAQYLSLDTDQKISQVLEEAFSKSKDGIPVIVDVKIDYSKRTRFTSGIVKTNLLRFPFRDKFRFVSRALVRKVTG